MMNFDFQVTETELTLFYSLVTGKIKQYCMGNQTMDYFGDDKEDYNYGVLVVENDQTIIQNLDMFIVKDHELIFNPTYIPSKYMR